MSRSVEIHVPPAIHAYAPDAGKSQTELRDELARLRTVADALTTVCCALLKLERDAHAAILPRSVCESVKGARVNVSETPDGDVLFEWEEHRELVSL